MKWAHHVVITVFAKPEEDSDFLKTGLTALAPFNLEEEKLAIKTKKGIGFNERVINVHTLELTKQTHTRAFLEFFVGKLSTLQRETLLEELDSRIDDECHFFIRIHKQSWAHDHDILLTDSGKCYHINITLAAFPKKRENAIKLATALLTQKSI